MSAILCDMAECVENPLDCDVDRFFNLYKILVTELGETKTKVQDMQCKQEYSGTCYL